MLKITNIEQQETQFMIYRDGELDKGYYLKMQTIRVLRGLGHVAYRGIESVVDALDEFVQSAQ